MGEAPPAFPDDRTAALQRQIPLPAGDGFRDLHITIDKLVVQTAPQRPAAPQRPPRRPLGPGESLKDYLDRRDGKKR